MGRNLQNYTILDAATSTGAGVTIKVEDYRHIVLSWATDGGGTASLTTKIQGSIQTEEPDFDSAQSVLNHWTYIESSDLNDSGNTFTGATGIAVSGADAYYTLELNTNGLKWLTVNLTARTAGSVTVKCKLFNNK